MRYYDVAIVGAGYSGAILAWILASRGRSILLVDRGSHPRFAIGESSTPLADVILDRLADRYGLAPLASLARYGRWKSDLPQLVCGVKRGFSYFQHHPGQKYTDTEYHERSLLVAANESLASADTHWLRRDVDHFLVRSAEDCGVDYRERTTVRSARFDTVCQLELITTDGENEQAWAASTGFIVDASGNGKFAQQCLPVRDVTSRLQTFSRATYGHFVGIDSWSQQLRRDGWLSSDEPFDADQAAQHHMLEDGWLWMLRFDNGCTSVGRVYSGSPKFAQSDRRPAAGSEAMAMLGLQGYPSLLPLFSDAHYQDPAMGLITGTRMQQAVEPIAGQNWALLPTAAATIDPLHSVGIAHGIWGVQQMANILLADAKARATSLAMYAGNTADEIRWLDALVSGSYASLGCFRRFTASTMLYFIAAIDCEERIIAGESPRALWSVDRSDLMAAISDCLTWLSQRERSPAELESLFAARLKPWNGANLMDASVGNRYRYTAAEK